MLTFNALVIHIVVMLAWCVVIFSGLVVKRYKKKLFKAYVWIQSLGVIFMLIGAIGVNVIGHDGEEDEDFQSISKPHVVLGYIIISLALAQPVTGGLTLLFYHYCGNSTKDILSSWYYKFIHTWMGRTIVILLGTNIFLGILIFTEANSPWRLEQIPFALTMIGFILCVLLLGFTVLLLERQKRNREDEERRSLLAKEAYSMTSA